MISAEYLKMDAIIQSHPYTQENSVCKRNVVECPCIITIMFNINTHACLLALRS